MPHLCWVSNLWIVSDSTAINVRKIWKNPFLLTNMLCCSEIPHLGYKGRHKHMFFNFVEVDNELLHSVTTPFWCFFFLESLSCAALCVQVDVSTLGKMNRFWISVLGCIVCSSALGQNEWLLDLCPVLHFAFKWIWVQLANSIFWPSACNQNCMQ